MLNYLEVNGTDYEMGYQIGLFFQNYLKKRIVEFDEKLNLVIKEVNKLKNKLELHFPQLLDEIYGRADGANVSRESMLLMFFPEIYRRIDGCTTVIVKKKNAVLFAHNEDNKNFNLENVALIKYNYGDRFVISYTMAERLAGSAFSMNSSGILFSSNYIKDDKLNLDNLSRYIVVRDVINSKSIEAALQKLKNNDVASAFGLNILDINTKQVISVEKDIHEIYVTEVKDRFVRSNHFHYKKMDNYEVPKGSQFRYEKCNELIEQLSIESCSIDDLLAILMFHTDDYFQSVYKQYGKYKNKSETNATLCIDTSQNYITIYDYMGNSKLKIDLKGNIMEQSLL